MLREVGEQSRSWLLSLVEAEVEEQSQWWLLSLVEVEVEEQVLALLSALAVVVAAEGWQSCCSLPCNL